MVPRFPLGCAQKVRFIETLRARLAILKHLNRAANPLLRYCDFSEDSLGEEETLGRMVMELKGAFFYDTKVRSVSLCLLLWKEEKKERRNNCCAAQRSVWDNVLKATVSNANASGGPFGRGPFGGRKNVVLNRMKASTAREGAQHARTHRRTNAHFSLSVLSPVPFPWSSACKKIQSCLPSPSDTDGNDPDGLKSIFGQLFEELKKFSLDDLKGEQQLWSVDFVGEGSIDAG